MSDTKIVTGLVRFSYANVFTAKAINEGDEPKYSLSVLIPKDREGKATIAKLENAIKTAVEQGKESKWGGKKPRGLKLPLRDGDEEREDDPNYSGMYFFNCSSKRKPTVIDANKQELFTDEEFYSGCWGRVSINVYPFAVSGSKGVAIGLNNIQKLKDDERFGGGSTAEEDFDDDFADQFVDQFADPEEEEDDMY